MSLETAFVPLTDMELRSTDNQHYISGIAVPWGRRTDRAAIPEIFDRGAFDDLLRSDAKVKLTDYNHSRNRIPVGHSVAVEDRDAGLWVRFRFNRTPEGESARLNSEEGVYGGLSVGFIARADTMIDGVRHVRSARLDHVSLVETPAYEEAVILDVRSALDAEIAEWRALIARNSAPIDINRHMSQNVISAKIRRGAEK